MSSLQVPDSIGDRLAEAGYAAILAGESIQGLVYVFCAEFTRSVREAARSGRFTAHPDFEEWFADAFREPSLRVLALAVRFNVRSHVRHGTQDHG